MAIQIKPEQAYAYAELLEILSFTDESLVNKIPKKLMTIFNTYALETYENHLDRNIPLENQNVSKKTAALIALLSLNYWCETEEEKSQIKAILAENEKQKQKELREKYNPDNIFSNQTSTVTSTEVKKQEITSGTAIKETTQSDPSALPVDYSNLPWYKKVFTSFKNFIFKIFSKEKNPT